MTWVICRVFVIDGQTVAEVQNIQSREIKLLPYTAAEKLGIVS